MYLRKWSICLMLPIIVLFSAGGSAATDAQKKMELLKKLDQLDALEFSDSLNRANSCISKRDFSCAESHLKKASRLAKTSQQRSHLSSTQSNLDRERSRVGQEKRDRERERRRLAEQERRWEEEQERLREMEREQQRSSKPDAWGAVIGGLESLNRDLEAKYGTVDEQFRRSHEKAREVQQEAVRRQREKAERERKEYMRRQQEVADQRAKAARDQERRHEQERKRLLEQRAQFAREHQANCERDGGRYDAATNNCVIIKKQTTFIAQDIGTNQVLNPASTSSGTVKGNAAANDFSQASRTQSNAKERSDSSLSQNKPGKKPGDKPLFDIPENRTLCWSRIYERTNKEQWQCSGATNTSILWGNDLDSTSRGAGCANIRRDFHNINFTHPTKPDFKYHRAIIRACGEPYDSHEKKVDEKFRIHYPASVVMLNFKCDSKVFLGSWKKYCSNPSGY